MVDQHEAGAGQKHHQAAIGGAHQQRPGAKGRMSQRTTNCTSNARAWVACGLRARTVSGTRHTTNASSRHRTPPATPSSGASRAAAASAPPVIGAAIAIRPRPLRRLRHHMRAPLRLEDVAQHRACTHHRAGRAGALDGAPRDHCIDVAAPVRRPSEANANSATPARSTGRRPKRSATGPHNNCARPNAARRPPSSAAPPACRPTDREPASAARAGTDRWPSPACRTAAPGSAPWRAATVRRGGGAAVAAPGGDGIAHKHTRRMPWLVCCGARQAPSRRLRPPCRQRGARPTCRREGQRLGQGVQARQLDHALDLAIAQAASAQRVGGLAAGSPAWCRSGRAHAEDLQQLRARPCGPGVGLRRLSVKASARTSPCGVRQGSQRGSYTPVGISRSHSRLQLGGGALARHAVDRAVARAAGQQREHQARLLRRAAVDARAHAQRAVPAAHVGQRGVRRRRTRAAQSAMHSRTPTGRSRPPHSRRGAQQHLFGSRIGSIGSIEGSKNARAGRVVLAIVDDVTRFHRKMITVTCDAT